LVIVYNSLSIQPAVEQPIIEDPLVADIDPIDPTFQKLPDTIEHPVE